MTPDHLGSGGSGLHADVDDDAIGAVPPNRLIHRAAHPPMLAQAHPVGRTAFGTPRVTT
jgi:hypothetical protein